MPGGEHPRSRPGRVDHADGRIGSHGRIAGAVDQLQPVGRPPRAGSIILKQPIGLVEQDCEQDWSPSRVVTPTPPASSSPEGELRGIRWTTASRHRPGRGQPHPG